MCSVPDRNDVGKVSAEKKNLKLPNSTDSKNILSNVINDLITLNQKLCRDQAFSDHILKQNCSLSGEVESCKYVTTDEFHSLYDTVNAKLKQHFMTININIRLLVNSMHFSALEALVYSSSF